MSSLTVLSERLSSAVAALPDSERVYVLGILRGLFVGISGMGKLPESVGEAASAIGARVAVKVGTSITEAGKERALLSALEDLRKGASPEILLLLESS